jgi:uncharacterized protein with HEPN domain
MKTEIQGILFDIIEGCKAIERYTSALDLDEYSENELIQSAVERQFITIGEALNRIKVKDPEVLEGISDAPRMIGFRNILVHGMTSFPTS